MLFRNPNEHHRQDSVLAASKERNRFRSITWEQYDPIHQKYLEIGEFVNLNLDMVEVSNNRNKLST